MTDTFRKWWSEYAAEMERRQQERQKFLTALGVVLGCQPIPPGLEGCGCAECNDYEAEKSHDNFME